MNLVHGGASCAVLLEERSTALAQSQSCPINKQLTSMGRKAGFGVRGSHLHWGLLFCFLNSHCVGVGGEMAPPQSLILGQGISNLPLFRQASRNSEQGQHLTLSHNCPVFFLWHMPGIQYPILKHPAPHGSALLLWSRASPHCWWKAFCWHFQDLLSLGRQ